MFQYEDGYKTQDVVGETWRLILHAGHVGTTWWCWGDLNGDLKGRKLHQWREGFRPGKSVSGLSEPELNSGEWVLGCNPTELVFENQSSNSEFRFIE